MYWVPGRKGQSMTDDQPDYRTKREPPMSRIASLIVKKLKGEELEDDEQAELEEMGWND